MKNSASPLRCLTVDDEPHALKILGLYIEKTPFLELSDATQSPWEALEILQKGEVDLLFLDIQMEGLTGLQLLDVAGKTCPVILTTAYTEYALEGYEYQVSDYLLKPFSYDRFLKAVTPIFQESKESEPPASVPAPSAAPDFLFVKGDAKNKYHKLALRDIQYIEGLRNYVQFICTEQKVVTLQNLKSLIEELPGGKFLRIHKSYIINLDHLNEVNGNSVRIGENVLPVGESYRQEFFKIIKDKWIDKS